MNKKTIVFDFDGVIHLGYEGWKDGSIYGTINWRLKEKDTYDNIYNINKILGRENTNILSKQEIIEKLNSVDGINETKNKINEIIDYINNNKN